MKCSLCSPPASIPARLSSTIMHEHHVKQFHLGPYKPFKCTVPNCDQSVTVAHLFASHSKTKHNAMIDEPEERGSEYLDALSNVMMQYNYYASRNCPQLACNMVQAIEKQSKPNQGFKQAYVQSNPSEMPELALQETKVSNAASRTFSASSALKSGGKKESPCTFCTRVSTSHNSLKLHEDRVHNLVSSGEHKCEKCPIRYHFNFNYRNHLKLCGKEPMVKRARKGVQKKKKPIKHTQKGERTTLSRKRGESSDTTMCYYCSECKESITKDNVRRHIAWKHIKEPVAQCNGCVYTTGDWKLRHMRKHVENVHKGKVTFTDLRPILTQQLVELRKRLIKRVRGVVAKKQVVGKGRYYCKKCKISVKKRVNNMNIHLTSLSHIGKYCLHCNGCQFKTFWDIGKMMKHMKQKHQGINVGYTDKRDEIREQLAIEQKLYIEFRLTHCL